MTRTITMDDFAVHFRMLQHCRAARPPRRLACGDLRAFHSPRARRIMERMVTLTVNIPEDMSAQIREICARRRCGLDEAVRDVLRRWIAVEQFRKDAAEVRQFAEAAGFRSEEDIIESTS